MSAPDAGEPGAVTCQIPLGYFGDPSDLPYLVAFLWSPTGRYITAEHIYVDGGVRRAY